MVAVGVPLVDAPSFTLLVAGAATAAVVVAGRTSRRIVVRGVAHVAGTLPRAGTELARHGGMLTA